MYGQGSLMDVVKIFCPPAVKIISGSFNMPSKLRPLGGYWEILTRPSGTLSHPMGEGRGEGVAFRLALSPRNSEPARGTYGAVCLCFPWPDGLLAAARCRAVQLPAVADE